MDSICPTETYHTSAYPSIDPSLPALSSAGKNVVVTGGGSGMGPEIARAFAQSGASTIALLGRTEATLLKSKERIEAEYPTTKVTAYVADVVSASDLEEALTAHRVAHGKLHVLVANAGYLPTGRSIIDSNVEDWWTGFEVNVKGNFNLVRAFIPHAVHDAAILSNNTAAAHIPYLPGLSGYSASKMAGARLFEYLHHEYPEMFVLNVQPGAIQTAMYAKAAETGLEFAFDDVSLPASFMVWAASKEARFLNGKFVWTNWDVDELKAAASVIEGSNQYTTGLVGWQ